MDLKITPIKIVFLIKMEIILDLHSKTNSLSLDKMDS